MKKLARRMLACMLLIFLAWGAGFADFILRLPHPLPDNAPPSDAIVVLTGGPGRIERGLTLLAAGKAPLLFISGVERSVPPQRLLQQYLPPYAHDAGFAERIFEGAKARNTIGNVIESEEWMRARDVHSIRLVTARYHMPRSLLEFEYALPDMHVIPVPVDDGGDKEFLLSEYHKWLAAHLRHIIIHTAGQA